MLSIRLDFIFVPRLAVLIAINRERNRAIERIRQPTVPTADHHSADDQLAKSGEVTAQTGQVRRIAERQSDIAVCGDDFEEDGEDGKRLFASANAQIEMHTSMWSRISKWQNESTHRVIRTHDPRALGGADTKHAQKDVPQIETQLVPHMRDEICFAPFLLIDVLIAAVQRDRPVFVVAAGSDSHRDWVDRDVHHHHETELNGRVDVGEVESSCTCVPGGNGLEEGCRYSLTHGQNVDFGIVEVESDDEEGVDEVEREEDGGECPGCGAREQEGVASARVVEQKSERQLQGGCFRRELVHDPDYESQEARVACVASQGEEAHG